MKERREIMLNPSFSPSLQVTDISYHYDHKKSFALKKQSIALDQGKLLVILGPSGSGKSTLLQLIAGLLQPDQGSIVMDGKPIHHLPPEKRNLSMIFQKPYLLPFLTVGENIEIGLKLQGKPPKVRRNKAEEILNQVGLTGFYHRPLSSLSGGQEQRVALARSLAIDSSGGHCRAVGIARKCLFSTCEPVGGGIYGDRQYFGGNQTGASGHNRFGRIGGSFPLHHTARRAG
jgi:ABC-type nitrate/sulfonate/bicarbonate transport system ATPase subunit